MIEYVQTKDKAENERRAGGRRTCVFCGRAINPALLVSHWIQLGRGGAAVLAPGEEDAGEPGYLGWFPVGPECYSSRPELKGYAKEKAKLTRQAVSKIVKWTSSIYSEVKKPYVVAQAFRILSTGKGRQVFKSGCYSERHDSGAGADYLVDGEGCYVAVGRAEWIPGEQRWEFEESSRYEFAPPEPPASAAG